MRGLESIRGESAVLCLILAEVAPKVFREGLNCADLPVIGPKIEVVDTRDIEKNLRL